MMLLLPIHFLSNFARKSISGKGEKECNLVIQGCLKSKPYDLIIAQGIVYDGLGNPGKEMDIAIKENKIHLIGENLEKRLAKKVLEVPGLAVSPGFVDAHSHTGVELIVNPKAESQIRQGVTTEISGRGIDFIIVNGKTVVNEGDHTGQLPGRILKKELP